MFKAERDVLKKSSTYFECCCLPTASKLEQGLCLALLPSKVFVYTKTYEVYICLRMFPYVFSNSFVASKLHLDLLRKVPQTLVASLTQYQVTLGDPNGLGTHDTTSSGRGPRGPRGPHIICRTATPKTVLPQATWQLHRRRAQDFRIPKMVVLFSEDLGIEGVYLHLPTSIFICQQFQMIGAVRPHG